MEEFSIYNGLVFEQTCFACPEQYDVYNDDAIAGYVRLRWGHLRCYFPDVGGETIYEHCFEGGMQGMFWDKESRELHLTAISNAINAKLEEKKNVLQGN